MHKFYVSHSVNVGGGYSSVTYASIKIQKNTITPERKELLDVN